MIVRGHSIETETRETTEPTTYTGVTILRISVTLLTTGHALWPAGPIVPRVMSTLTRILIREKTGEGVEIVGLVPVSFFASALTRDARPKRGSRKGATSGKG